MKASILLIIGVWIGMLIGISFVEAPLKFQAPNITLPLALGIGKLVFSALNKFEIFFSVVSLIWVFKSYHKLGTLIPIILGIPIVIVALQTFWLLPILHERVESIVANQPVPDSYYHLYYVAMEVIKVILLIPSFIKIYNHE